ncbi:MAG: type II secretion system protein GspD, partial [Candidatus Hinthialibacter sp.]
ETDSFQSLGTSEEGDSALYAGGLYQEGSRDRFNLSGGGGSTDLLQFLAVRFYPDVNTNSIVVLTPDEETLQMVSRIITTFDKPQRMIELETRSVRVSLKDLRSINFDYTLTDPFLDKISLNPEQMQMDVSMSTESNTGLNLGVHTFNSSSRLDFVMNLLESQDSFQVLNAPKVLTLANPVDPPLVFVGQQIPYADSADFDDQGDDDPTNNRLVINYERTFTGTMLAAIPFILNDDHIYLELNPQVIEPGERLPIEISGEITPGAEVPNVGPLLLNQQYIRTTVRMKNGSTMVMGGLITERENESKDMIPFLSKIPFLGNLFIDRNIEKEKVSTLYFITARIIEPSL